MATVYVTRKVHFNAAHRLHNPQQPDAWNEETYGVCNSPDFHGHNYVLEVTVAGEPDPETGYVLDLGRLKVILHERVVDHLDHKNLNVGVDFLRGILPSTENLCIVIWDRIKDHLPRGELVEVKLYETPRNWATYRGEGHAGMPPVVSPG